MHSLKKKLMFLYITTTGTILIIVVIGVYFLLMDQINRKNIQNFQTHMNSLVYRLQSDSVISGLWLSQYEEKNHLLVQIKDNETPFFFRSSWLSEEERTKYIKRAKDKTSHSTTFPFSAIPHQSERLPIFSFRGENLTHCYGTILTIPASYNSIELTMVQIVPEFNQLKVQLLFLFLLIGAGSIFILFLISRKFVRISLAPVIDSQRKQTEFIAAASHELRSPLAVILTNAQALMQNNSDRNQFLPIMLKECRHMKRLIDDMLLLASSDAKTWTISKKTADIDTLLIELYESYSTICQREEKPLLLTFPDYPLPPVSVDAHRFNQIIGILVENALSYSQKGSTITIRPSLHGNKFCIQVIDHGTGLSSEEKEHVFDRFYRTEHSHTNTEHFGLGLSIAKELTLLHGGQLSVSDTSGGGCTFQLILPL